MRDLKTTGRKIHNWSVDVKNSDGTFVAPCQNCGLQMLSGPFLEDGTPVEAFVYLTPRGQPVCGRIIRSRPLRVDLATKTLAEAFPGILIDRMPECPKDPTTWEQLIERAMNQE